MAGARRRGLLAAGTSGAQIGRVTSGASGVLWMMLLAGVLACGDGGTTAATGAKPDPSLPPEATGDDRDGDGLCNGTEAHVGTDPDAADSDGDAITDLVEAGHDIGALDPTEPSSERVAILDGRRGARIDFAVRATVSGDGDGQTGAFEAERALYDDDRDAEVYFSGAVADSADPRENVRGIDYGAEKFTSVEGETRLAFTLRFEMPADETLTCVRAYPFRYTITSTRGDVANEDPYLLVVVPEDGTYEQGPWCGLAPCL
jgi:hypothetical protein